MANLNIAVEISAKDNASGPIGRIQSAISGLGGMSGILGGVGKAFSTATASIGMLGGVVTGAGAFLVNLGSDAQEMKGKFDQVFKGFGGQVTAELDAFGNATGRSTFELQGMAAGMQDLLVPIGFARGEAARMSTDFTKLAVDLGSFNNIETADVMRDLQAAVTGETDSLKKYGIVANETAIKQEAFNMGLYSGKGDLDAQTKALAVMSIIMKSTSDAQGDATRTAGGWANQMRALQATLNETGTTMGLALLPVLQPILAGFNQFIGQVGPGAVAIFQQFATTLQGTLGPAFLLIQDAWNRIIVAFGYTPTAVTPAQMALQMFSGALSAIVTAVQVFAVGMQGIAFVVEQVRTAIDIVSGLIFNLDTILTTPAPDLYTAAIQNVINVFQNAFTPFATIQEAISSINTAIETAAGLWEQLNTILQATSWEGIASAIAQAASALAGFNTTASNTQIPPVLTPGSPTPFEVGLKGVAKALTTVGDNSKYAERWIKVAGGGVKQNFGEFNKWSVGDQLDYWKGKVSADQGGTAEDGSRVGPGYWSTYAKSQVARLERHVASQQDYSQRMSQMSAQYEKSQTPNVATAAAPSNADVVAAIDRLHQAFMNQGQPPIQVQIDGKTIAESVSKNVAYNVGGMKRLGAAGKGI